ncbi:hypothetical protein VMCG_03961 [Cytospora schulzeri]|uniref:Uncharacterized protein n=1 Tax=Cytospora schulzeri TaxID=448051 RepID=A0A423WTS8_9PEZI|nr:hypothetical protein VMCG_03961 [Valsa malicola]
MFNIFALGINVAIWYISKLGCCQFRIFSFDIAPSHKGSVASPRAGFFARYDVFEVDLIGPMDWAELQI